jgi:hypothetical protein
MKNLYRAFFILLLTTACRHSGQSIVNSSFADSLLTNYSPSLASKTSNNNLDFWKKRMDSLPDNFINGPEYAAALSSRFHMNGNINDLREADSLMKRCNEANQGKEPGIFRTLVSFAMLQHRFADADSFFKKAMAIEGLSFPNAFTSFDVSFERGKYKEAKALLPSLKPGNSYGYLFRRAKYEHYEGCLDSAISCMLQAAEKAGKNNYLKQAALSNAADLCMHKGKLREAYNLYRESIQIDAADLHSLMGIGWIALAHDKNDSLAQRIFSFVWDHTHAPDVLLKLEQVAEARGDSSMQKEYAEEFVLRTSDSVYGLMYSKYLIDLYTDILRQPAKAVALAEREITNRPTPQTFAWYAWSLYCNNEKDKAYAIFKNAVSGKRLEGLELYDMGKMMQGMNKGYNAGEFFKAAYKNRYDLSPAKQKDVEQNLE